MIGSEQERKVAKFVNRYSTRRKQNIYKLKAPKELNFTVTSPDGTLIGNDMDIEVSVKNMADSPRKLHLTVTLVNAYYTGVAGTRVKTQTYEEEVQPKDGKTNTWIILAVHFADSFKCLLLTCGTYFQ